MTLGSLAFGGVSESITLSTNYDIGNSDAGNGFSGIAFRLTPGTDRYVNSDLLTKDATYELTGITIQWRNNDSKTTKVGDGVQLVVTNATDMKVLGISNSIYSLVTGDLPGKTGQINLAGNTFAQPITLSLDTSYYAFYVTDANVDNVKVGETLSAEYVASVNLMAWGKNGSYTGGYNDFGLTQALAPIATTVAPHGALAITKTPNVPEPMTGTLSLLALAGLCIRRRK